MTQLAKQPTQNPSDRARGDDLPEVMTVEELAELLRCNRKTAYEQVAAGKIPGARRVGRIIRISRTAVLQWLAGEGRVSRRGAMP